MLRRKFIFSRQTQALATIALFVTSIAVVGQSFPLVRQTEAASVACADLPVAGISASGFEKSNPPSNAIDNNMKTRWSQYGKGSWLTADLGAKMNVCGVDIAWYRGNERVNSFVISISSDGKIFTTVYTGKSSGTTSSSERYSFSEASARYIRITVNSNTQTLWTSISEIGINGYAPGVIMADTLVPSISITSPADGSILMQKDGKVTIFGTAADETGLDKVEVRIDDGAYSTAIPKAAGDWSTWSITMDLGTSGLHKIVSRATDTSGNQGWRSIYVNMFIDTGNPSVAIVSPAASTIVVEGIVPVQGTSADNSGGSGVSKVEVKVDSGLYKTAIPKAAGDWSTWSTSFNLTSGQHTIYARTTDIVGNQALASDPINVVTSGPTSGSTGDPGTTGGGTNSVDKFGIKKIYPTKAGSNEWYVNMADPKSDSMFRNLPTMTKQADGSWQVSASQVRMEAWSPSNQKWLNVEITEYAKIIGGSNELLQMYSRGGHHTDKDQCLGSAYKGRLYGDGHAAFVKEITHPAYAGNRGTVQATNQPLDGRWVGFKAVIYNVVENGKTYVHMESYIDDGVTDSNGNLVIKNNWKLASVVVDKGGWGSNDSDFNASCFPTNKDSTQQYRQRDEIHNLPGGTSTQNIAAFRSDDLTWNWKYLSVREIQAP
jgi:F5/8 type C domain-containing protein/Big-like domain-containing protein